MSAAQCHDSHLSSMPLLYWVFRLPKLNLSAVCCVSVVLWLSALTAAVIGAGQGCRARLLSGELGCPGTALLLPCWLPVLLGKNPLA